jgi:hypothetical protein
MKWWTDKTFPQVVGPVYGSHYLENGWVCPPRDFLEAERPISGPYYLRKGLAGGVPGGGGEEEVG